MELSTHSPLSPGSLISIVIPVFNEEAGIEQLRMRLRNLRSLWKNVDLEFIFVDDGSSDQTLRVLRETFGLDPLYRVVAHDQNRGVGAANRTAFQHCRGDIICTIDADCTYGPENLLRLVEALAASKSDIAVASPYHPRGAVEGVAPWRIFLSKACSWFYWLIAPVRLYTYTSVFRAYTRQVIDSLEFEEDGFVFTAETLIRAAELGFRIVEVPMTLHSRVIGQTKMKVVRTIRGHLRLIGKTAVRRIQSIGKSVAAPVGQSN